MAKFKIQINKSVIKALDRAAVRALEKTAEAVKTEMETAQVIPFDEGTLQNESTFVDTSESSKGRVSIVFDTPYARKIYFHPEFNFQKINNANAQGEWCKPWIEGSQKDFAKNAFAKLYKREAGT